MKITDSLANVDIEDLDAFEQTFYNDYIRFMSKTQALQEIINNANGDYSQLSETLAEIAQQYELENE
jgi:hypothetical protein